MYACTPNTTRPGRNRKPKWRVTQRTDTRTSTHTHPHMSVCYFVDMFAYLLASVQTYQTHSRARACETDTIYTNSQTHTQRIMVYLMTQ